MFKKTVSGIILTFLLVGMLALTFNIQSAKSIEDNWWNSNWTYRRQVNITERSGYSLVNFPVEVVFRHDGRVQADGRDIRVIENDTEIPFTITELNSTHVTIILQINLTSLSTKNIYVYYGNPSASAPNYSLVPLTILEGNNGYAIIDNRVYIGWNYTSWGWSNNVELWNDFRVDFNGNNNPTDDNDLIRDYGSRQGGIARHRADVQAIGLGEYQGYVQTPIYVDIKFADAKLRVYKNQKWVETTQADKLFMFSPSYTHANYGGGTEQNIVDGEGTNRPELWNVLYLSKENPGWMAFRDSSSGYVFASTGLRIGVDYAYVQSAKETSDWDRVIDYSNRDRYDPLDPYDQPPDCRIYWYADNSNSYSKVEKIARILNNQPSIFISFEEIFPSKQRTNASVDVYPQALNLISRGKWITAYIELPEGYNVADINVSSILLNDTISAELRPIAIGDYDNDSIPDLMVKFDRAKVIGYIMANVNLEQFLEERFIITLTITGYLNDGTLFQGSDTIRIIYFIPRIWRYMETLEIFL